MTADPESDPLKSEIPSLELKNFRKIQYAVEGYRIKTEDKKQVICIISAVMILGLGLPLGIGLEMPPMIIFCVLFAGLFIFLAFPPRRRSKDKTTKLYSDVHKRIMDQGVLCLGVITGMNEALLETDEVIGFVALMSGRHTASRVCCYKYTVRYTDAYHNEKTTETYIVANPDERNIGKRCTVYEHEGKVIVDAIEK